jgi:3-oxoacyl-[acyl-carrier-protein] synthase II
MEHRVVITGMGIVSPIGSKMEIFRQNLLDGVCGIDYISRIDVSDLKVKVAAEVRDFTATDYMTKIEANKNDRFTQFGIGAAAQAVEDSGISGKVDPFRFGVYFGSGIGGFNTFTSEYDVMKNRGPQRVSPHFVPKMISNIAAGQIAIKFGAKGPCISAATACATGTTCIGEAFHAIRYGYADAIIAGGTEASIEPLAIAGFTNCMALTQTDDPTRASIPFDKDRSGFVMGEGAGALILESWEHAKMRGAKIYAEVVGYGSTCDAHHVTAPDPNGEGGGRAIRLALEEACYLGEEKVYINAHGTSTPMNDPTETKAIKYALGEAAYRAKVSSTKSMTGHMLGAAGAAEAIASVIALETGMIPPTIHYQNPDPECDLDITPNAAVSFDPELALSVSLGFGGHNACIAVRRYRD